MPSYAIARTAAPPVLDRGWDDPAWNAAAALAVDRFHPKSASTHPVTRARLLHDGEALYGVFRVEDRWVRSVTTAFMGPVCTDSCVELFIEPAPGRGYVNLEMNAGGTLHASHVVDPTRRPEGGFADWTPFAPEDGGRVRICSSLPAVVEPEIEEPVTWTLAFAVPFAVLERYVGAVRPVGGAAWRANLYKCGDRTSHPHWATWAPIDECNFHAPQHFAKLQFAE
ncbi:MAG: carbohydrate-binding family 9-like protein [Planctomycetota bacterium]